LHSSLRRLFPQGLACHLVDPIQAQAILQECQPEKRREWLVLGLQIVWLWYGICPQSPYRCQETETNLWNVCS
jgi:hypothetical protein